MVYTESVVGVVEFPCIFSLQVLLYCEARYDFENSFDCCQILIPLKRRLSLVGCFPISHSCHQYHLHKTLPVTLEQVIS